MKHIYQKLQLNNSTKLFIGSSCCPLNELLLFCKIHVMFVGRHNSFIIGHDVAITIIEEFIAGLFGAVNNERLLDASCYNIGFVANEYDQYYFKEKIRDAKNSFKMDSEDFWIGYKYLLFGCKNKTTWLYNNQHGKSILEITPYFNNYSRINKTYAQWIKYYKPILKLTLNKDIMVQWIDLLIILLRIIRINAKLDPDYDFMMHRKIQN